MLKSRDQRVHSSYPMSWVCGIVVGLMTWTAVAMATPDLFEWRRPLSGEMAPGTIYRMAIPSDVYDRCHQFPHDARVFDEDGIQWPLDVKGARPRPAQQELPMEIVNRTRFEGQPGRLEYYRLDLRIPPASDGARRRHNRIQLTTAGSDFVRRVEIYGAESFGEWGLLGAGYIVRHPRTDRNENEVTYADSNYPYLQVRVYPNVRDALEYVEVRGIRVLTQPHDLSGETHILEAESVPVPRADERAEAQVIILDVGYRGHPVTLLRFDVKDREFVRRIRLFARDEHTEPWRRVGVSDLFRLGGQRQLEARADASGRFWKIQIDHYDDAPLSISSLEVHAPREEWLVEARGSGPAALYYGSEQVAMPRYDLAERVRRMELDATTLPLLELGAASRNPAYRRDWFQQILPWLISVAVTLASVVVIFVIVQMLRRPLST